MWPPGHLAFGYLCLVAVERSPRPSRERLLALALGTQFPDLVDKPLSWWLAVVPSRSLAHSALVALFVLPAAVAVCRRLDRPDPAAAFAFGTLSHLFGDALWPLLTGAYADLGFLLWPLTRRPAPEMVGLGTYVESMLRSPYVLVQALCVVAALGVWWHGGDPDPSAD